MRDQREAASGEAQRVAVALGRRGQVETSLAERQAQRPVGHGLQENILNREPVERRIERARAEIRGRSQIDLHAERGRRNDQEGRDGSGRRRDREDDRAAVVSGRQGDGESNINRRAGLVAQNDFGRIEGFEGERKRGGYAVREKRAVITVGIGDTHSEPVPC